MLVSLKMIGSKMRTRGFSCKISGGRGEMRQRFPGLKFNTEDMESCLTFVRHGISNFGFRASDFRITYNVMRSVWTVSCYTLFKR